MRRGGQTKPTPAYLRLFVFFTEVPVSIWNRQTAVMKLRLNDELNSELPAGTVHHTLLIRCFISFLLPRHLTFIRALMQQLATKKWVWPLLETGPPVGSRLTGLGSVWCDNWPLSGVKKAAYARLRSMEVSQIWVKVSGPLTATHPLETRKDTYYAL